MRKVGIIGIGQTKFGELWDKSFRDIGIEAGLRAMNDAKITGADIGALYIGNMCASRFIDQEHIAALIADYSGMVRDHIPAVSIEAADASGGVALNQAYMAVASGLHDIVVVGGAEKMTDIDDETTTDIVSAVADQEWEGVFGATNAGLHAMIARRHMHKFGTTREELASVAVKNHANGALNPLAQFQRAIKPEMVLGSPEVATPLGMFDCAPMSDGASSLVLCPLEKAKKFSDTPIEILSASQASDTLALHDRRDSCTMDATVIAGQRALKKAGKEVSDIDVVEVHDNYTISEILAIEDLGFVEKGKGGKATADGETAIGGRIPVNTSGGLKARGHPFGATGVAQAVEVVTQLRGEAEGRQIDSAETGMTQNVGGTGGTVIVHIFGRCN